MSKRVFRLPGNRGSVVLPDPVLRHRDRASITIASALEALQPEDHDDFLKAVMDEAVDRLLANYDNEEKEQ